jgi:hypothetical protein
MDEAISRYGKSKTSINALKRFQGDKFRDASKNSSP